MKVKLISFLLLCLMILSCYSKQKRGTTTNSDYPENKSEYSLYYNSDSSYFVMESITNVPDGLPKEFLVVKTTNQDTIYTSNKNYEFIKWDSNEYILLRKRKGTPDLIAKDLSDNKRNNNRYYLSINNIEITQTKTTK